MKLASLLTFASLGVSAAFAQGIQIGYPLPNTSITPGSNITVQVIKPEFIDTEISVGLAIGMLQCTSPCPSPLDQLGEVLYAGAYDPVFPPPTTPNHQPQQNFTVAVPSYFERGQKVQLAALVYTLIGAGPSSTIEQAPSVLLTVQ